MQTKVKPVKGKTRRVHPDVLHCMRVMNEIAKFKHWLTSVGGRIG